VTTAAEAGEPFQALLGDEYDRALIARTWTVLAAMGGKKVEAVGFVAGSQEVSIQLWELDGVSLRFEAETYIGFSVEGPRAVVAQLVARLAAEDRRGHVARD
jgi:hypothetical protein